MIKNAGQTRFLITHAGQSRLSFKNDPKCGTNYKLLIYMDNSPGSAQDSPNFY
jgi:hypothetical protein